MNRMPTYLRMVLTTACTMRCTYCHAEGLKLPADAIDASARDQGVAQMPPGTSTAGMKSARRPLRKLSLEEQKRLIETALANGVRKIKFLGGEPLLVPELPALISHTKHRAPDADVSLITAGAVDVARLEDCIAAGLDRANLSIHGFGIDAFRRQAGGAAEKYFALRNTVLDRLLSWGRPLKLNTVYTGPEVESDLAELLEWASSRPVLVNVLDDLNQPTMGPDTVREVLMRLRGPALLSEVKEDPHSLPTELWTWRGGARVEIKSSRLGELSPWGSCAGCSRRSLCREGIFALRLDPDGMLRSCVDRPDLVQPLISHDSCTQSQIDRAWKAALMHFDAPDVDSAQSQMDLTTWAV